MNLRRLSIPCISLTGIALTSLTACASHAASTLGSLDAVLPSVPAGAPAKRQLLLYAGGPNQNVVGVYPARSYNPPPQLEIRSGLNVPTGIAVDASGNVYVCNNAGTDAPVEPMGKGTWTVSVYHRGQTTPFESYTTGVWNPVDVAVASDGTVYIANYSSAVTVYPAGSLQPSMSLAGPSGESPLGVALDGSRNVYVSYVNPSRGGSIYKYAPGQSSGSDLGIAFSGSPHGLAIDRGGNLLVAVSTAPSPGSSIEVSSRRARRIRRRRSRACFNRSCWRSAEAVVNCSPPTSAAATATAVSSALPIPLGRCLERTRKGRQARPTGSRSTSLPSSHHELRIGRAVNDLSEGRERTVQRWTARDANRHS